jgi:hypothetical protein
MAEIFASIMTAGGGVTLGAYLISLGLALLCGLIVLLATSVRNRISKSFAITVFLLPAIVHTVIIMVNGNIGTGIAVAGAFSLVRFRSVPGRAREIASIFLSMTAGLTCASGYVAIAVLFTALISVIMLVFSLIPIKREREYELHITVPESLNYYGAFDSVFKEYTRSVKLVKSKTSNMGSLYKLTYIVDLKNPADSKNMIDSLRERNGNLEIALNIAPEENEL